MANITRWMRRLAVMAAIGLGLALVALGIVYWLVAPRLPDVQELRHVAMQVPLSVYSRDGKLIAQFGETRRYPVKIAAVPVQVRNAFIAIEDAHFYQHQGLDFRGITRAVWLLATTSDKRVPGGSTITQQVAKNFYLSSEYSYSRKLMEMALALKMERELSKDEILQLYLNKIFFGNRAYGVAAAAEYYYGKPLDQLSLAEAATLAATPKFPSSANPIINPERNIQRRNYVLQRMREVGFITQAQEQVARAEPSHASPHQPKIELDAPYVAEMVRAAMQERYGAESETSGFRVFTTVLSADQVAANKAVRDGLVAYDRRHGWRGAEAQFDIAGEDEAALRSKVRKVLYVTGMPAALVTAASGPSATVMLAAGPPLVLDAKSTTWTGKSPGALLKPGDLIRLIPGAQPGQFEVAQLPKAEAALVSLQPEDGALRALVGGLSFSRSNFNRATQAQRQPGSSFKPFLYSAALERGYTPATIVLDAPVVFRDRVGHVWRPQNDNGKFSGPMRMREALVQSRNLVSVRLLDAIGVEFARKYITQFGFKLESLPANLSMSLGTASLTPMSVARGYTVFANGGFLVDPYFIERVVDRNGVVIASTHAARACRLCPQRINSETRAAVVVDDFDFSAGGPSATTDSGAAPTDQVGPSPLALAPRAIDERTAYQASSMMRDVVQRGTATAAKVLDRADIGGKTGSTNDHRDAWFSGFGGDLVTTVWVGRDHFETLGYREYGGKAALPIWISYMGAALKNVPLKDDSPPNGIMTVSINRSTGGLVPDGTPGAMTEYFKTEDYDRIVAQGYNPQDTGEPSEAEAFDIF
ncbi:MAG: penicillin-binding protein 1A [Pseudoxanthomonas sp.]